MAQELNKPIFIISLDVELMWGFAACPSHTDIGLLKRDDAKGRGCIDALLNIFEKHNIPATWAIVGHLFLDHCKKEDGMPHKTMPRFKPDWYSADPCTDLQKDPLYYGRDIVEKILSNQIGHEIGYHSFSHVVFSECSRKVAEAEIKIGNKLAKEFGITLKSFVPPENKIGDIDVLKENGFKIYRGENLGVYGIFRRVQYLREKGIIVSRSAVLTSNIASQKMDAKFGSEIIAKLRKLVIFKFTFYKETPLPSPHA